MAYMQRISKTANLKKTEDHLITLSLLTSTILGDILFNLHFFLSFEPEDISPPPTLLMATIEDKKGEPQAKLSL